ncbi:MAG TPA: potassium transporter TrkA, partial [Planctomycetaceae bacterium]|nr:potassium transporter TrkA [Planctomycetaceae bacterium]
LVVAVKREDGTLLFNPEAGHCFGANHTVMVMGHSEDILRFRSEFAL